MNEQMIEQESIDHSEGSEREGEQEAEEERLSPSDEEQKKAKAKKVKMAVLGIVLSLGVVAVIVVVFGKNLLSGLEGAGDWLQDNKVWGILILSLSSALTSNLSACIPVVYATVLLLAGYTHGYAALAYSMPSTIVGSTCGFILVSTCFKERISKWLSKNEKLDSYKRAIGRGGIRIVILIRSVPGPYGLITFLLGVCDVTVLQFVIASVFGVMRQILHISIGASVKDLQDIFNGKAVPKAATFIVAGVAVVLTLITAYWARKLVAQEVASDAATIQVTVSGSQSDIQFTQAEEVEMASPTDTDTGSRQAGGKYARESV